MRSALHIILILPFCCLLYAQPGESIKESFEEGEYFLERGEYSEAAHYYRKLVDRYPDNCHYNFKLGTCFMQIPGSETLAIPYFEKAVTSTVEKSKFRTRDMEETNAPLHAWFFLGNVYRIGNRLDDALHAYNTFINSPFYYNNYNVNIVENEIKSCERAKIIMDSPIDVTFEPLDTTINTTSSELFPAISGDGQTLVFVRKLKFYDAILMVTKQGSQWSRPVNLNPLVGSDGDFYPVSLSHDGKTLFLVRNALNSKDLYVSFQRESTWTKAEPLGRNINSGADETWACLSSDGKTLCFTSARKGGKGGLDIYFSSIDSNNQWGKARNAGKAINTSFDEDSPCLTGNDQLLFFSSKGHYSMGGYDIFCTRKNGNEWKEPVNIGYPLNNTADNLGYSNTSEIRTGYYSKTGSMDNETAEDIYRVILNTNMPLP